MEGVVGVEGRGDGVDVLLDTSVKVGSERGEEAEGFVAGEGKGRVNGGSMGRKWEGSEVG